MARPGALRQKLADVIAAWIASHNSRGFSRLIARRQERAALAALYEALSEADEPLAGVLWARAYEVAVLWGRGASISRAMGRLISAYGRTLGGRAEMGGW